MLSIIINDKPTCTTRYSTPLMFLCAVHLHLRPIGPKARPQHLDPILPMNSCSFATMVSCLDYLSIPAQHRVRLKQSCQPTFSLTIVLLPTSFMVSTPMPLS